VRITEADRVRLVQRNTLLLAVAQVVLWAAVGTVATFGPISVFELTGREGMAGVLFGTYALAQATGARVSGRFMDRAGRRPGLAGGYVVLGAGGAGAALSVASASTVGLMISAVVLGFGAGTAQLGRAAVADMYPPERRGRAVGMLLVAGTIGAVGGPPLSGLIHSLAERLGLAEALMAPWLLVPGLATAALAMVLRLRPDPRELAVEGEDEAARRPIEILRRRPALLAVLIIAAAQVVMVTFMSVIPVVLHSHGTGALTVSIVVSLHLAGMFAFSPLIGTALDRWGRRTGLVGGSVVCGGGALLALAEGTIPLPSLGLLLIGVGWSAAYIASTAVVSDVARSNERAGAVGLMDLIAALSSAIGVLGGAALLNATGIGTLVVSALLLLAAPTLLLLGASRPRAAKAPTSGGR
jgi:MFS family permease